MTRVRKVITVVPPILLLLFALIAYLAHEIGRTKVARAAYCRHLLGNLVLAMTEYRDKNGAYPPLVVFGPDQKPLYNWRVLLLKHLPAVENRYQMLDLAAPWTSQANRRVLDQDPIQGKFYCPRYWGYAHRVEYVLVVRADQLCGTKGYTDYRILEMPASRRHFADPLGGYMAVFGDLEEFAAGLDPGGRSHFNIAYPDGTVMRAGEAGKP